MQMEIEKVQAAIEAILFTMGESVELSKIAEAIGHDEDTTRKLIHNMMDRYEEEDQGSGSSNWIILFSSARKKKCMNTCTVLQNNQ